MSDLPTLFQTILSVAEWTFILCWIYAWFLLLAEAIRGPLFQRKLARLTLAGALSISTVLALAITLAFPWLKAHGIVLSARWGAYLWAFVPVMALTPIAWSLCVTAQTIADRIQQATSRHRTAHILLSVAILISTLPWCGLTIASWELTREIRRASSPMLLNILAQHPLARIDGVPQAALASQPHATAEILAPMVVFPPASDHAFGLRLTLHGFTAHAQALAAIHPNLPPSSQADAMFSSAAVTRLYLTQNPHLRCDLQPLLANDLSPIVRQAASHSTCISTAKP